MPFVYMVSEAGVKPTRFCFWCQKPIEPDEDSILLFNGAFAHLVCANQQARQLAKGGRLSD